MALFHFSKCACTKCSGDNYTVKPVVQTAPGTKNITAVVHRTDPRHTELLSGRANVRVLSQPVMKNVPDRIRESDYYAQGKDDTHAMSRAQVALTMTPMAYRAVMADRFSPVPQDAPALASGIIRGGQSGLFKSRINIRDVPSIAYGDIAEYTSYGLLVRG